MAVDVANFFARTSPRFNPTAMENDQYNNALLRGQVEAIPQQRRMNDQLYQMRAQSMENDREQMRQVQLQNAAGLLANRFAAVASSPWPKLAGRQFLADQNVKAAGSLVGLPLDQFTVTEQDTDEDLRASAMDWARALGAQTSSGEGFTLTPGQRRFNAQGEELASVSPEGPSPTDDMREYEYAVRQGYNGSFVDYKASQSQRQPIPQPPVAVVGPDGVPVYVSRPDAVGKQPYFKPTGGMSPRDSATARAKITQIAIARQQVKDAKEKFERLRGTFSAGLGGDWLKTQSGNAFDAAVDVMRSTIGSITRVPGVGAMSDYETRLDQAKMPSRGDYEEVTVQKLDALDAMLNQLEQGYSGLVQDAPNPETPGEGIDLSNLTDEDLMRIINGR